MSIYATLWCIRLPDDGIGFPDCQWVELMAQAVPAHIGAPEDYPEGDPYGYLPPIEPGLEFRAVVVVRRGTHKGTERCHQEYPDPLLVLSGREYAEASFEHLLRRLLRAVERPRRAGPARYTTEAELPAE